MEEKPSSFLFASSDSPLLLPWKHPFLSSHLYSDGRRSSQCSEYKGVSCPFSPIRHVARCRFKIKSGETQSNTSPGCVVRLKHSSTVLLSQECKIVQVYGCESSHLLCSLLKTIFQEAGRWRRGCSSKRVRQQNRTTRVGRCCLDEGRWI